ncbi:MAG: TIGR04540 family protein [Firmicutes bacterium]|nr:TIGR04540 family protein [Bacillota bacterium]
MGVKTGQKEQIRFITNPLTVKQMAAQINVASDAYVSMKISENDLRELLYHYAKNHSRKLFGFNRDLNPTITKIIGKKRKELVEIMLAGLQITLF